MEDLVNIPRRILRHWRSEESHHGQIARSFLIISLFVLLAKVAGAAKEIAIAWRYGVSAEVDAYLFVFNIASWPASILFGVLSIVLVPLYTQLRLATPSESAGFRSELSGATLLAGVVIGLCLGGVLAFTPFLPDWSGLGSVAVTRAQSMIWPLMLLVPLGMYSALLSADIMSHQRHGNSLLEGVPALVLLGVLLITSAEVAGVLAWGTAVGFLIQTVLLLLYLQRISPVALPRLSLTSPAWDVFGRVIGVVLLAQFLQSLTALVDQFWAARLEAGTIAAMGYANRLLALFLGLGATAIGRAALPVLSRVAVNDQGRGRQLVLQWSLALLALGCLGVLVLWPLTPWLVSVLFERGAFTGNDTWRVAEMLQWGLLQIPFYFSMLVYVQQIAAEKKYGFLVVIAIINLAVKLGFNAVLVPVYGAKGLFLATAIMYISTLVMCVFIGRSRRDP